MYRVALEVCIDTPDGIAAAMGADRIELCSSLALGGLTPGVGLVASAIAQGAEVHAMVRPRAGDFVFSDADIDACLADIAFLRTAGVKGIVIGAANEDGTINEAAIAEMVAEAGNLDVTLHRVVDISPDPVACVNVAKRHKIKRILTSGGASSVREGFPVIKQMIAASEGVEIMAGGGLTIADVEPLIDAGIHAIHSSCGTDIAAKGAVGRIGINATQRMTDAGKVAALKAAIHQKVTA